MYLWKVDKLVEELKKGEISQRDQFLYLMLFVLLYSFIMMPHNVLIIVLGVYYINKLNSKGDNKDFLLRYISLSVPIGLHLIVVYLFIIKSLEVLAITIVLLYDLYGIDVRLFNFLYEGFFQEWLTEILVVFTALLYIVYLGRKIKQVTQVQNIVNNENQIV